MERGYRRGHAGRRKTVRRSEAKEGVADRAARRGTIRLAACGVIFALAVLIKLLFPGFAAGVGAKLTTAVDYKAALAALGAGISGDKEFTEAIGEAITYAFRGAPDTVDEPDTETPDDSGGAADSLYEDSSDIPVWSAVDAEPPDSAETAPPSASDSPPEESGDAASVEDEQNELANAIVSAFLQTQEGYSDYDLPAGTTYDMPVIGAAYAAPVAGNITSPFGYRPHPVDGNIKFHYGIDVAAEKGAEIYAFAGGTVLAVGESTTLGKYVIITHDGFETLYAHCDDVLASSGQAVNMGELIANVGNTGNATSYCLHFELKVDGVFVNPAYYILSGV